jgi:hypothetical protein
MEEVAANLASSITGGSVERERRGGLGERKYETKRIFKGTLEPRGNGRHFVDKVHLRGGRPDEEVWRELIESWG